MSETKRKQDNAADVLYERYIKGDPEREKSLEQERVNAEVAQLIYDLRKDAGLSQKELAGLVGTTQSAISRLEDADYEGHSLSMLNRIAKALNRRLTVSATPQDSEDSGGAELRRAFQMTVHNLRKASNLTIEELSEKTGIDRRELLLMEHSLAYRPSPPTLRKLGAFYDIPPRTLLALAGAAEEAPESVRETAAKYAAKSESAAKLTDEERQLLDEFVSFLKSGRRGETD
ncbi:MAG: helix-turn-helix domain-containing protein [Planctomycetota bacterium]